MAGSRTPRPPRSATAKARALGIAAVSGTAAAAADVNVTPRTVRRWIAAADMSAMSAKKPDEVRTEFCAGVQFGFDRLMAAMALSDDVSKLAVAFGIVYDKWALMSGQATARTEHRDLTDDDDDAIRAAADAYVARLRGAPARLDHAVPLAHGEDGGRPRALRACGGDRRDEPHPAGQRARPVVLQRESDHRGGGHQERGPRVRGVERVPRRVRLPRVRRRGVARRPADSEHGRPHHRPLDAQRAPERLLPHVGRRVRRLVEAPRPLARLHRLRRRVVRADAAWLHRP